MRPGKDIGLTDRQCDGFDMLLSDAMHTLFRGGSRSGKTALFCWAICGRAAQAPSSRHLITRHRFNHVKASIGYDTLPAVFRRWYPDLPFKLNKEDWFFELPHNKAQIWLGGLDDKERTEKILGQEYCTIFLNECSEISYHARNVALTRLAQNVGLRLRMYYDCNPPLATHWTHRLFIEKRDPNTLKPLADPEQYQTLKINPIDNQVNLSPDYLRALANMPTRMRQRFFDGDYGSAQEGALWTFETIDKGRIVDGRAVPDFVRIVIAIDPSGTSGEEDKRSDKVGIVVAALGLDGDVYILEDLTMAGTPAAWGRAVAAAYDRHNADCVIGEENFGGAMVRHVIQWARPNTPYRAVTASRGKAVRAEPISALYDQGRVHHVGVFADLEDQMCSFTTFGYMGDRSPDRADAMIWAVTELFPKVVAPVTRRGVSRQAAEIESPFAGL